MTTFIGHINPAALLATGLICARGHVCGRHTDTCTGGCCPMHRKEEL